MAGDDGARRNGRAQIHDFVGNARRNEQEIPALLTISFSSDFPQRVSTLPLST